MATLADITNAAGYQGNAALGGFGGRVYEIDTKPIQQLAAYTLMYNKSQYDQRQKDADEKINQLSKLTTYDLTTGIPKDKDELLEAQSKLIQYRSEEASKGTPSSPKEKMQREVEFLSKTAQLIKKIDGAGARKIKLDAYKNEVQKSSTISAKQKELRIKQAEDLFNNTDILTLPAIPNHDLTTPTVGETVYDKIQTYKEDASGNLIVGETRDEYSFTGNAKMGYLEGNDLMFPILPKNATPQQQAEYEQKKLTFSETKMGGWKDASQFFSEAVSHPNYKKTVTTNGINVTGEAATTSLTDEIDLEKITASNPIAGGLIQLGKTYNNEILKKIDRLEKQQYESSITGKKPLFSQGADTPENLRALLIDVKKPLTPENLASLARFEKARPDKVEMKLIETGIGIKEAQVEEQRRNNDLDFKVQWKNAETARINALKKEGGGSGGGSGKPEAVISQPAILFGEHINRLKTEFSKNNGKDIIIPFRSVDEKTRVATKLKDNQYIVYKQDGSYAITADKSGLDKDVVVSVGTIDNLAQGFIDAVKTIDLDATKDKDGTMAEGFQVKSEAFFNQTFGTASGRTIWEKWSSGSKATTTPTTTNDADNNLTDAQYFIKYKKARQ